MEYIEIKGKVNTAICYAKVVEDEAIEQIKNGEVDFEQYFEAAE